MKRPIQYGFEFIFSISLILIMALPPFVLAQSRKSIDIRIMNGDTVVNGKAITALTTAERAEALAAIKDAPIPPATPGANTGTMLKQNNNQKTIVIERNIVRSNADAPEAEKRVSVKRLRTDSAFTYHLDTDLPQMDMVPLPGNRPAHLIKLTANSQNFNFTNTDNDGIGTNIHYTVTDAPAEKLVAISGVSKTADLLTDLNMGYEFTTGKTLLNLNFLSAGQKEITFYGHAGSIIWTDKSAALAYSRKFALPVNGLYYLQVKQGNKVTLKKIVKE
ncbi:T9SS type A sorting domain-containing protein [Mucilaginibacter sp.]|uniref:T9SS type A sorting domain-containing protein n=1 Tax=Mucilaginibacter sp. TaxID=1882438 RepID=UPI000CC91BAA|nr:T9SS type A sorting domain-containing protein [Mucilaginibacter sp.]PLW89633.1 MAG: hypothetical protein C0154_10585 [Mucilaginibacter sp.]HEK19776.1 T9SS type A sorting domain-containing protein [Bacteroidota bacterium]